MHRKHFLPFFVFLMACGGGGGGDVQVNALATEFSKTTCAHYFQCCDAAELEQELGFFDINDQAECVTVLSGFSQAFLVPSLQRGIDNGRIVYHPDRMGACLAAIESLSCTERQTLIGEGFFTDVPGCEDPMEGQVADGGACASDEECQNNHCDGDSVDFNGNVMEGVCGPPRQAGDPCPDFECGPDLVCDFNGQEPVCQPAAPAGAECFSHDDCASGNCAGGDPENGVAGACSNELRCDGN